MIKTERNIVLSQNNILNIYSKLVTKPNNFSLMPTSLSCFNSKTAHKLFKNRDMKKSNLKRD